MSNRVLLLHGYKNQRPTGHWLRWLAAVLRSQGHLVWYPQFPSPEQPVTADWQALLSAESQMMDEVSGGEKIAIAHSLGCLNWLLAASSGQLGEKFDRALWVAPPDPELLSDTTGEKFDLGDSRWREAIAAGTNDLAIVASDSDQWLPRGIEQTYGLPLAIEPQILVGAGHFSLQDGWGPWPSLNTWVNTGDVASLRTRG